MNKKKIFFLIFAVVILLVPLYVIFQSEKILKEGHLHKLRLDGYDPFDPFRGKYIRLNYDTFVSCDETLERGDNGYVLLEKDSLGFSFFKSMEDEKPDHSDYIQTTVLYADGGMASFETDNMSKYFINENKASKAETIVMDFTQNNPDKIYVAIRVLDGDVRLEDIYVEETPLLEYLENH